MNRHSKHRTRTRRAHHALQPTTLTNCQKCKADVLPHRVCQVCGTYNGRQVLNVEQAIQKKLKKSAPPKEA